MLYKETRRRQEYITKTHMTEHGENANKSRCAPPNLEKVEEEEEAKQHSG